MPSKRHKDKKFFGGWADHKLVDAFFAVAKRRGVANSDLFIELMTATVKRDRRKK